MKILKYFPLIGILLLSSMQCSKKRGNLSEATQNQATETPEGNAFLSLAANGVIGVMDFDADGNAVIYNIQIKDGTSNAQGAQLNLAGEADAGIVTGTAPASATPRSTTPPAAEGGGPGGAGAAEAGTAGTAPAADAPTAPAKVQQTFVRVEGREIPLPGGFYVEVSVEKQHMDTKTLGKGSQGTAYLVKDAEGKLWALKFDNRTLGASIGGFLKSRESVLANVASTFQADDVDVARSMQAGFANPLEARLLTTRGGIPVVIKTAVTGGTLKEAIQSGNLFDGPDARIMQQDLQNLFYRMSTGKMVYEDLNTANLLWDPEIKQWVVIDAKPPQSVSHCIAALTGNINSMLDKLPVAQSRGAYEFAREVKLRFGAGMHLPSFSLTPEQLAAQGAEFRQMSQLYANVQELLGHLPTDATAERRAEAAGAQATRIQQALRDSRILSATPDELRAIGDQYLLTFEDWRIIGDRVQARRPLRPTVERSRSAPLPAAPAAAPATARPSSVPPQRTPVTPVERTPVNPADAPKVTVPVDATPDLPKRL